MKLQFKHQKFQADAANVICDIFKGQRLYSAAYLIDRGISPGKQGDLSYDEINVGIRNHAIELSDIDILENLQSIQNNKCYGPMTKSKVIPWKLTIQYPGKPNT
jgi:type III restriction enzyme